jgi:HAD superfamily hydrolase (TIGR01509 family)
MKLIVFDCDGVLINSEEIYVAAEMDFLSRIGAQFERETYMRSFMGLSPAEWREKLESAVKSETGRPLPAGFHDELGAFVLERLEADLAAMPGAFDAIGAIKSLRCVASSTPLSRLRWKLERAGLSDLFTPHIFSSDMVRKGKPAPDLFLHAAATMGIEPYECLVVEDSANGVLAGKAAGMQVIGFIGGKHCPLGHRSALLECGAGAIVEDFRDLNAAIDALDGRNKSKTSSG